MRMKKTKGNNKTVEIPDFSNIKAEQCLLSSILLDNDSLYEIEDKIRPEFFFSKQHQDIYEKILELHANSRGIDFATLIDAKIDSDYVEQLASMLTTSTFVHDYADAVIESHIKREYIGYGTDLINNAEILSAQDLALLAESKVLEIGHSCESSPTTQVMDCMMEIQDEVLTNMAKPNEEKVSLGILSGIGGLDRLTLGFKAGKVYVLAGRPGAGKTALITSMVNSIAVDQKIPTAIYSIEMDKKELMYRELSTDSQVKCTNIELGRLTEDEGQKVLKSIKRIAESPLYINDESSMSASKLKSNLRKLIAEKGIKIAFIDYLGLMDGDGKDNYHKITKLSNEIRKIAKDLNIPIVLLCQLNREVEKRGQRTQEPTNADLRDSGAIEQDAYCIIFIDRPEMRDPDDESLKGKAVIKVTKNRGGRIGKSNLEFLGETYTFRDVA